jgi:stage II sporulation protein D
MTRTQSIRAPKRHLAPLLALGRHLGLLSVLVGIGTVANFALAALPALAALEMRVAIERDVSRVTIGSSTNAVLRDGSGQVLAEIPAMGALTAEANGGRVTVNRWTAGQVWVEPEGDGFVYIGNKWYRGRTLVVPTSGGITAVNYVDLEEYLYSVVGAEMPASWPLEALKSQAVAARSYALYQRQTGGNAVFDVGNTTSWQVYSGLEKEASSTQRAVRETAGQVLVHDGRIIEAVFHSASGGHTENVEDIWTSYRPYLRAVRDYDQNAPVYQWTETFSADQLRARITGVGNILSLQPERRTNQGRIISMRVVGDAGTRTLSGNEMRQALNLRSTLFEVVPSIPNVASSGNSVPVPTSFQVQGRGFGHGLGLSQWGAREMATQGYNYQQIVSHYYSGANLAVIQVE